MAQHDMDVANAAGATVRADINNALQALVSRNSGSSAPSTTFAYMEWVDTTTGVKKRRNAANSGWLVDSTIDETLVLARSSNTILGVSDKGKTVVATGSWTQTLTAAATLADGWFVDYRNDGSGSIVLDPNSTEQIDGATTQTLAAGESCRIVCNGSAFKTIARVASSATKLTTARTLNGTSFDGSANISVPGVGIGQTWTDETSSRAFDTDYTNSTALPITVVVTASTNRFDLLVDGVTIQVVSGYGGVGGMNYSGSIVVPAGGVYRATNHGASYTSWFELR